MSASLFIGYDPREDEAYQVCVHSVKKRTSIPVDIAALKLPELRAQKLYTRLYSKRNGQMFDLISDAPMSTEFAISRFLTPILSKTLFPKNDWAIFCDCDFLWLDDIANLIKLADPKYAVMCVQHHHEPTETVKMDAQMQVRYARKNWSSLMMFNCSHPSNNALTVELINKVPGRDLHRFCWLKDEEIGALPTRWNWLEGHNKVEATLPSIVHYTRGGPWFEHMKHCDYAQEYMDELADMRRGQ
mgnify:FL=1